MIEGLVNTVQVKSWAQCCIFFFPFLFLLLDTVFSWSALTCLLVCRNSTVNLFPSCTDVFSSLGFHQQDNHTNTTAGFSVQTGPLWAFRHLKVMCMEGTTRAGAWNMAEDGDLSHFLCVTTLESPSSKTLFEHQVRSLHQGRSRFLGCVFLFCHRSTHTFVEQESSETQGSVSFCSLIYL